MKRPISIHITEYSVTHNPNIASVIDDLEYPLEYQETDLNIVGKFVAHHVPQDAKDLLIPGKRVMIDYESMIHTTLTLLRSARENKLEWLTTTDKDKREFAQWLAKEGLL